MKYLRTLRLPCALSTIVLVAIPVVHPAPAEVVADAAAPALSAPGKLPAGGKIVYERTIFVLPRSAKPANDDAVATEDGVSRPAAAEVGADSVREAAGVGADQPVGEDPAVPVFVPPAAVAGADEVAGWVPLHEFPPVFEVGEIEVIPGSSEAVAEGDKPHSGGSLFDQPASVVRPAGLAVPERQSEDKPEQADSAGSDDAADTPAQTDAVVTILDESFEGSFPSGSWSVSGDPTWDDDGYKPYAGSWSCWCANGGANGLNPATDNYAPEMNAWSEYGPFDLSDAESAELRFRYWGEVEEGYDSFGWYASVNGTNYSGYVTSGNTGAWVEKTLDFANVPELGNLCGQSQVWIAFVFESDESYEYKGAFIDNVTVTKNNGSQPNLTPYKPATWDDEIVVSSVSGTTTEDTIYAGSTAYIDYAYINNSGEDISGRFHSRLYVNGTSVRYAYRDGLAAGFYGPSQDFAYTFPSSGSYTLRMECDVDNEVVEANEADNAYERSKTVYGSVARPNVTPYQPSGWADRIVVSAVTNTNTEGTVYAGDTAYIDYAYINNGDADITSRFDTDLYINGSVARAGYISELVQGNYGSKLDFEYVFPSAGSYTLQLVCDAEGDVVESNESDNSYQRSKTVLTTAQVNVTPYQPSGWDDKVVVSSGSGSHAESAVYAGDTAYIDYAYINNGTGDISAEFHTSLHIDGAEVRRGSSSGLQQNHFSYKEDFEHVFTSAGSHTLRVVCDDANVITESNESDNEYQRSKSVSAGNLPNLTPYQPSGWSGKIVVSAESGTRTESTVYAGDVTNIDYAYINNGAVDVSGTLYTQLYVDGVSIRRASNSNLQQGFYAHADDVKHTFASPGSHTLRLVCDVDGDVAESNEGDNSHERTVSAGNNSLPDITPYQPGGWDDKIVVSSTTGTRTNNTIYAGDTGYIDYAYRNEGAVDCSEGFYTELHVNGSLERRGHIGSLAQGSYGSYSDFAYTFTNAGSYVLRIICDVDGEITEGSESNNEYQRSMVAQGGDPVIRIEPTTLTFQPAEGIEAAGAVEAAEVLPGGRWVPLLEQEAVPADAAVSPGKPSLLLDRKDAAGLALRFLVPGLQVQAHSEQGEAFDLLQLGDYKGELPVGSPDIPTIRKHLYVPAGKVAEIEVDLGESVELPDYNIYPVQPPAIDAVDAPTPAFAKDAAIYASDEWLPEKGVRLGEAEILHGNRLQLLSVCPFQYNPASRILRAFPDLTVNVRFVDAADADADAAVQARLASRAFDDLVRGLVVNPQEHEEDCLIREQSEGGAQTDATGAEYLIITDPAFVAAANTLRDWKNSRGLSTLVKTTGETGTSASQIKSYIQNAYNNWSPAPTYLLLLGDVESIPTTYETTSERGTDLYYATVDGSDYVPDIFCGRISVNSAAEASTVINKIVNYEQTPPAQASFYNNVVTAAYFQDGDPYSGTPDGYADRRFLQTAEEIRTFLTGEGYDVRRIYTTHTSNPTNYNNGTYSNGGAIPSELLKSNGFAWDGDANDILDAVNDGAFLVVHRDHGADRNGGYSFTGWGDPLFTNNHIGQLVNGNLLPVVLSFNCQTGWFDGETDHNASANHESFCELLLRRGNGGAVAVIGATRNSYSGYNDYFAKGMIDCVWPDHLSQVANSSGASNQLGPMIAHGRLAMDQIWSGSQRKIQYELFHIHGDPSMRMWTSNSSSGGQGFTIHNDGTADLQITSLTKQSNQAWLSFTPAAPLTIPAGGSQMINVNVDWALAQGAASSDRIVVSSNDPDLSPYPNAVLVNLDGGSQPVLELSTGNLVQSVAEGGNATAQNIQVWNAGSGTLSYSIVDDASWLSVTPASGSSSGEQDSIQVSYLSSGLSPGTYTGTITVTAAGASGSPRTVQVSLSVLADAGSLLVSPVNLSPTVLAGQNAAAQQFTVTNSAGGGMSYTVSDNASWLAVSPSSGSSSGEQDTLQVSYSTSTMDPGTYDAVIIVTAAGASGSPADINVRLNVVQDDDRYEENDTLENSYNWTSIERERKWLSEVDGLGIQKDDDWYHIVVEPGYEQVHVECTFSDSEGDIDIALHDAAGANLASSTSTSDDEEITHTVPGSGDYYIRVYYGNVGNTYDLRWDDSSSGSVLACSVTSLTRTVSQGLNPPTQSFEVWNAGGGAMSYSVSDNAAWLSVSPGSGSSVGEHDTCNVSYATASMAAGSYSANITVTAAGAADSPLVIPVSLAVTPGEDAYENNDDLATAWNLSTYPDVWLSDILGEGVQYDDDWFMIQVGADDPRLIEVECRFIHAEGDIDLALHDSGGTRLAYSLSVTDNESLSYEVPAAGSYFLRVYYENAGNGYDLRWGQGSESPTLSIARNPSGGPDAWTLELQSVNGLIYHLEKNTTLDPSGWGTVKTLTGDGSLLVVEVSSGDDRCFYRFRIETAQP